ncbi:MAG: ABC transporter permease [Mesorhizobium sp.]|nr:MAG: ABC transporter permease [Mesorhizobium sp.]
MRRVWMALAHEDIGDQHRRTTLGPLWLLVNYFAFAGTFVVIFGHNASIPDFPAYVALGLFVWLYLSEVITLAVSLFTREQSFIMGTTLPLTVYVMRMTMQSVIRAAYAFAGCLVIMIMEGTPVTALWLWSVLALALIVFATPAVIMLCAIGGAFFPDVNFIVQNLMRVGMFVTPIFWVHPGGGIQGEIYRWNPFTYFLEIVRMPITTGQIPIHAFGICVTITVLLWAAAVALLGSFRRQIVFVL